MLLLMSREPIRLRSVVDLIDLIDGLMQDLSIESKEVIMDEYTRTISI